VKLLFSTSRIVTVNFSWYHYNYKIADNSLTRNSGIKSTIDQINATMVVEEYINTLPEYSRYKKALTKRKFFYSYNLVADIGNIIFKTFDLSIVSSFKFLSPRSILTFIILIFIKLKIKINKSIG